MTRAVRFNPRPNNQYVAFAIEIAGVLTLIALLAFTLAAAEQHLTAGFSQLMTELPVD